MKKATKNLINLQEVDSTNNYANRLIATDSAVEGAVVLAHYQINGKGLAENYWHSEAGKNILASFILFPSFLPAEKQFYLSKITSLALLNYLQNEIGKASIKWPNDLYVHDKKIAGILIENSVKGNNLSSAVLGMGININQIHFPDELPNPVSIKQITGLTYNITEQLQKLTKHLFNWYEKLKSYQLKEIDEAYFNNLYGLNNWCWYKKNDHAFKARISGINDFGHLVLEDESGNLNAYQFKEIELVL